MLRFALGRRNPQSVADIVDKADLEAEDSCMLELPPPGARPPQLPVDASAATSFRDLPEELLEQIFYKLAGTSRKNYFAVSGVSRAWRRLGHRMFFSSPWDTPHLICHPNQLFCLSPRTPAGSRSGLLKCFVRREAPSRRSADSDAPPGRRISFYLGKDPQNSTRARFLMCAVQRSRNTTLLYLNSRCTGPPCAQLTSNMLCTSYTLTLDDGMSFIVDGPAPTADSAAAGTGTGGSSNGSDADCAASVVSAGGDPGTGVHAPCGGAMPHLLLSLRYRARIKGLMQPRRMDAALPNPTAMSAHRALPRVLSTASADAAAASSTPLRSRRPSLEAISSVAVLERPPLTPGAGPSGSGGGGDDGASSSMSSPAASPPQAAQLEEEVAAVPPPSGAAAAAAADAAELPPALWRRLLGLSHGRRLGPGPAAGSGDLLRVARGPAAATLDEASLPVCLANKSPHWNEALRCWCLNFRGRVKLASVKNFQLVRDGDADAKVVMQFGKVEKDAFILDFNPTAMSAVQAFAIALTTFDSKITL